MLNKLGPKSPNFTATTFGRYSWGLADTVFENSAYNLSLSYMGVGFTGCDVNSLNIDPISRSMTSSDFLVMSKVNRKDEARKLMRNLKLHRNSRYARNIQ